MAGARSARIVLSPNEGERVYYAGDTPARAPEIISPAGFERYFAEIAPLPPAHPGPPDEQALGAVMAKYGLEMDMRSIPTLVERHGLVSDEAPPT